LLEISSAVLWGYLIQFLHCFWKVTIFAHIDKWPWSYCLNIF
jgi:hypothetical protein